MRTILFSILFIILASNLFSQEGEQIASNLNTSEDAQYASMNEGYFELAPIDSSLNTFHSFYPNYKNYEQSNGNYGLAVIPLRFEWTEDWEVGLLTPYSKYSDKLVGNIVSYRPYTKLFYSNGTQQEQYFNLQHSQRIKKGWNITAVLDKINSSGFYSNQKSDNTQVRVSSLYKSSSDRFVQLTTYDLSRFTNKENGGLQNYSDFESNLTDKPYLSVKLNDASNIQRTHKLSATNIFRISQLDSTKLSKGMHFLLYGEVSDNRIVYQDNNSDSLGYSYFAIEQGSLVYDSLNYHNVKSEIGVQNYSPVFNRSGFNYSVFAGYDYYKLYQNYLGKTLGSTYARATVGYDKNQLSTSLIGCYYYAGYRQNDYQAELNIRLKLDSVFLSGFGFKVTSAAKSPNYQYQNYSGVIRWKNNLDKTHNIKVLLTAESQKLHSMIELGVNAITNLLYIDSAYSVQQYTGTTSLISASLSQQINLKKFHLDARLLFQRPLGDDYFRVPQFVGFTSLYFESFLFKKATLFRVGVDTYYSSSYYGNGYLPLFRAYYLQDSKLIGNYPYFDFFVAAQIKKARVFAKITHINSGFMGNTYYASYNYPMADRMIRLGVDWTFWD